MRPAWRKTIDEGLPCLACPLEGARPIGFALREPLYRKGGARVEFPRVYWDEMGVWAGFEPGAAAFAVAPDAAVIVFAWTGRGFLLGDISDRGWCVPSGRLEAGESVFEAAKREAMEETGARLVSLQILGTYRLDRGEGNPNSVPAVLGRAAEWGVSPLAADSRAVREADLEALPLIYYRWDALLEGVFRYARDEAVRQFGDS